MTREEITRIGLEAGISNHAFGLASEEAWQQVERFASLVSAAERSACAAICDRHANVWLDDLDNWGHGYTVSAKSCAANIRARGQE